MEFETFNPDNTARPGLVELSPLDVLRVEKTFRPSAGPGWQPVVVCHLVDGRRVTILDPHRDAAERLGVG